MASGPADDNKTAIYVVNTFVGGGQGAFSNHWRFIGCVGGASTGRFLWSVFNAGYNPNGWFTFSSCAFESLATSGYEVIYGTLAYSRLIGNYFAITTGGRHLLHLIGNSGYGAGNRIIGNEFRSASGYGIYTTDYFDVVSGNMFFGGSQTAHVRIDTGGYQNSIIGNAAWDSSSVAMVSDGGSSTVIALNEGTKQGAVYSDGSYVNIGSGLWPSDPVIIRVGGADKTVYVGAPDSGGAGYRMLRVAN
jgi:hypothetical protein